MARINLAVHPYLYQDAELGQESKDSVLACLYTSTAAGEGTHRLTQQSPLIGLEECHEDHGKMNINRANFLQQNNVVEVHLHPTKDGAIALSPNNCCFLVNMSVPIVTFACVHKQINGNNGGSNQTTVFVINVMTRDSSKCTLFQDLITNLQAINYLG